MRDDIYGYVISKVDDQFSKAYEIMEFGSKCAAAKFDLWIHNITVEKVLLKQDYYFKLSELGLDEYYDRDDLMEIAKFLDLISGCYLATRDKRYLNIMENFTKSKKPVQSLKT